MADKREGNYTAVKGWLKDRKIHTAVVYQLAFAELFGGDINTAILLNHLLFWSDKTIRKDGKFFRSIPDIARETGLTAHRIRRSLKVLEEEGIVVREVARAMGAPTNHFQLNMDVLQKLIWEIPSDESADPSDESADPSDESADPSDESADPSYGNRRSIVRKPQIMNSKNNIKRNSKNKQYIHAHSSEIEKAQSEKHKNESLMNVSFDRFWDIYPRKVSKGQAMSTWKKLWKSMSIDQELVDEILEAVRKQKLRGGKLACEIKYIPYPSTWLNALSWEDESGAGREIEGKDSDYDSGDLDRILALHKESRASR